ncbi:hypothetical protein CALVIDRAFT_534217 [Calocera viscosa TUFC12733]|uniref:Uncharacterized protein n=1 Tax=Calocera viscosa (strain TUFC12733) TaxID=1330018 RepID=A0A167QIM6_CALVF|nr:hypothetical protein CALVIDRAFT_534217 [Calocera viscosa TUFC12733]
MFRVLPSRPLTPSELQEVLGKMAERLKAREADELGERKGLPGGHSHAGCPNVQSLKRKQMGSVVEAAPTAFKVGYGAF